MRAPIFHNFAIIDATTVLADGEDRLALVLPVDGIPQTGSLEEHPDSPATLVTLEENVVVSWRGQDGRVHGIGTLVPEGTVLPSGVLSALSSDNGLLVFFVDQGSGQMRHLAIFKAG